MNSFFTHRDPDKHGDYPECSFCGASGEHFPLIDYAGRAEHEDRQKATFCELCYDSHAGNAWLYPSQHDRPPTLREVMRHINEVLNIQTRQIKEIVEAAQEKGA